MQNLQLIIKLLMENELHVTFCIDTLFGTVLGVLFVST